MLYTIGTGSYGRCQKIRRKSDGKVSAGPSPSSPCPRPTRAASAQGDLPGPARGPPGLWRGCTKAPASPHGRHLSCVSLPFPPPPLRLSLRRQMVTASRVPELLLENAERPCSGRGAGPPQPARWIPFPCVRSPRHGPNGEGAACWLPTGVSPERSHRGQRGRHSGPGL